MYSTEFCPRNRSEWDQRSSVISCTDKNGYMCLPNENRTELLEFCYIYSQTPIENGNKKIKQRKTEPKLIELKTHIKVFLYFDTFK